GTVLRQRRHDHSGRPAPAASFVCGVRTHRRLSHPLAQAPSIMNRRTVVSMTAVLAVAAFSGSAVLYGRHRNAEARAAAGGTQLVRPHSPVIGREDAPVTVVEFFDPSCEACRAFYPIVKQILAAHPDDVRVVLR